jgi:hypothetical protein
MLLLATLVSGYAQDFDKIMSISWDVNMPLSNREWIDETSVRGVRLSYRKLLDDKFMAGADFNWATYSTYVPTTTFVFNDGALTTDYFNYIYSYGLTISGDYILPIGNREHIIPFAGLGIGASMNGFTTYYNIYQDRENSWGFLVSPKIGACFPFGKRIGAFASLHYDFSTSKAESLGYDNFSSMGVQVGIAFLSY